MTNRLRLLLGLALVACAACASADYKEGEVLVKFKPGMLFARFTVPPHVQARVVRENRDIGWFTLRLNAGTSCLAAVRKLRALPEVAAAEPNYIRRPLYFPNDPRYPSQYGPQKIACPEAWNLTLGTPNVTIAVVDTGIDLAHPEFAGRIEVLPGCNFADGNSDPSDADGHGTHVSGIAAAATNNGEGIAGICQATIMPVRVFDGDKGGTIDVVSAAYEFAADNGAAVINASIGGADPSQEEQDAVLYAESRGAIFVAASGNDSSTKLEYPAGYPGVISVAASDVNDAQTYYTNYGPNVSVAAPGDQIVSTYIGETYAVLSGTSMACPHVAGALALVKSFAPPGTDPSAIENAVLGTCDYLGPWVRYGRVNVYGALLRIQAVESGSATVPPSAVKPREGGIVAGGVTQTWALDGATLALSSIAPYQGYETSSATFQFLMPAPGPAITGAQLDLAAFGQANALSLVYLYNWLKLRYDYVGQAPLSQTGDAQAQISLPDLTPYIHDGELDAVVRGYLSATSNGGVANPFTYQIDEAVLRLTVAH